ncbi:Mitochondrial presequence protease [Coemansia sp. RSA 1813]|nr:Mitochondrial presequence protease [Coemansia sp. RSA 1646]KAJ1766768.1 Mitochondrial presequence protease [Coemansia sp. RSA 1843]KAJ2091813.1 Mitochondrial presequence protease [Coemansia sp. RSA 986]KAJ2215861.1 Mitochondrial presequence protease [Coemansia sp. RSA 487]KAJ2571791.1 Mitochondrial presequence protease [Coemansia sp. RSA 1813]
MQSRAISGARILQAASRAAARPRTPLANGRALWTANRHLANSSLLCRRFTTSPRSSEAKATASEAAATKGGVSASASSGLAPGEEVHGFVVEDVQTVSELKLKAIRLRHATTGAEWLHIDRDDRNNVFSVGFSTSVSDSTGVPHILEHTTLCGSEKYPVRDPFFKMLNRSMSTFMNAWTAHDYTQYPFSTMNAKDYENLQTVYLDAVFKPSLREVDFRQEGWRLERSDPTDSTSSWQLKGVVYNEMKGAFSDAGSLFATRAEQQMFPGSTYQYVSGGDPAFIPDLTHEQLVEFHRTRYHPSNARFYSYGNFPLAPQLERVGRTIGAYSRLAPPTVPMDVLPFGEKQVTEFGPVESVGSADKQTKFSVSYLTNDMRNVYETFSMSMFSSLLLSGTSAPMHKALIDSHIGADYSSNTGYSPFTRQSSLSVGLQGMADKDIPRVEALIGETFAKVGEQGFERRRIDAALASVELAYKHKTADFGLQLMKSISTGWFHGVDPVEYLKVSDNVARLRADVDRGKHFEALADRYFANSKHKLKYVMLADPKHSQQLDQREQEMIQNKLASLSSVELAQIDEKNRLLADEQMKKEDLSVLPTLAIDDVAERAARYALDMGVAGDCVPVQWRSTATNGISYFRAINDVREKHPDLLPYTPLFCDALTYLGTQTRDMPEIETDIRLHTGGISFSPFVTTDVSNLGHIEAGVSFGSHCLDHHIPSMYDLVLELVRETNFDNTRRLRALLNSLSTNMFNDVADSGHMYARRLSASTLTPEMHAQETLNGIAQVKFISDLARLKDLTPVVEKLKQVQDVVFNRMTVRTAVTTNTGSVDDNQAALDKFLASYPQNDASSDNGSAKSNGKQQGAAATTDGTLESKFATTSERFFCPLPFATNYAAKSTRTVPYMHADSVKLQLLAKFLTPNYLHREIRERNGAYGGGASFSALQGVFSFFSYRDPSPLETVNTFARSIDWITKEHSISDREMTEAKLSVFGDLDTPLSVSEEGMSYFTTGITDDMRQERRELFFDVSANDLKDVAVKYLTPNAAGSSYDDHTQKPSSSIAVIGEEGLAISGEWKRVHLQ